MDNLTCERSKPATNIPGDVMTPSAFVRLYDGVGNPDRLLAVYDSVLSDLFHNPFWESGATALRRVPWKQGMRARIGDSEAFRSPGLYLWGSEDRPLYIGITRAAFSKRFSRYIWDERSQCNLAEQYGAKLVSKDIDGFPVGITDWYAQNFRGSKVRLRGAVRFAKEGISNVWFALFPHPILAEIERVERELIPVAGTWNKCRGLRPLLNIQEK